MEILVLFFKWEFNTIFSTVLPFVCVFLLNILSNIYLHKNYTYLLYDRDVTRPILGRRNAQKARQ